MQAFNDELNQKFNGLTGYINRPSHYGVGPNEFQLVLTVKVAADQWNRLKRKKIDPINGLHLVVDLSNFLYRSIGLGVYNPTIGGMRDRAKGGVKTLTFTYQIKPADFLLLGVRFPDYGNQYGFHARVVLGPIVTETNQLKLVVNG